MPSLRSGIIVRGSLTPRVLLRYRRYTLNVDNHASKFAGSQAMPDFSSPYSLEA